MDNDDEIGGWSGRAPPLPLRATLRGQARRFRETQTNAEQRLWRYLRRKQLDGHKFRRQHVIGRFIVDFYCAEHAVVIEVDGGIHAATVERDTARQQCLESLGLRVLRFPNEAIHQDIEAVLDATAVRSNYQRADSTANVRRETAPSCRVNTFHASRPLSSPFAKGEEASR